MSVWADWISHPARLKYNSVPRRAGAGSGLSGADMGKVAPWSGWRGCWVHFHVKPLSWIVIFASPSATRFMIWIMIFENVERYRLGNKVLPVNPWVIWYHRIVYIMRFWVEMTSRDGDLRLKLRWLRGVHWSHVVATWCVLKPRSGYIVCIEAT